jgi:predicted dehydrogenase
LAARTIRIGLLGASKIARGAIIAPAADIDGVAVTRVAASDRDRAEAYAREHGIPVVEDDYESLVASDAVDLVYNALPPSGHCAWTLAALANGKHVLCEKPFAMNSGEAARMVEAADSAPGVLIEAFHYRYHPAFGRLLGILAEGSIGRIQQLSAFFNVTIPYRPGELRHTPGVGGGALMDLGCYSLHWVRTVMAAEPRIVSASAVEGQPGVDLSMRAELDFDGVPATIECSMEEDLPPGHKAGLEIVGDTGTLQMINPLSPHTGHEIVLDADGNTTSEKVDGNSTYWHQLEAVLDVIEGRAEAFTGGADAVGNMRAIDAIYRAAGMLPRGQTR